jgi:sigma-B regulation protein RsbU (phosphoserine phosphatase)
LEAIASIITGSIRYLAIYVLDTAGHGLRATLPQISVLNLLRSRTIPSLNYYQPNDVLSALNNTFQMTYKNNKYFTIWYGVYNRVNRQLIYASAGHPPAVLLSGATTQLTRLQTPGIPVGMFPDAEYTNGFCNIEAYSSLYVFSDGAYEIHLSNGTIWELEAFIELLKNCRNFSECNLNKILNYLLALNSKDSFDDDLSILQINFN